MTDTIVVNAGLPTECIIPANRRSTVKTEESSTTSAYDRVKHIVDLHHYTGGPPTKEMAKDIVLTLASYAEFESIDVTSSIEALNLYIDTYAPFLCEDNG